MRERRKLLCVNKVMELIVAPLPLMSEVMVASVVIKLETSLVPQKSVIKATHYVYALI